MNSTIASESLATGFSLLLLDAAFKSTWWLVVSAVAIRCMRRCSAATRHLTLFLVIGSLLVLPILSLALPRLDVLPTWLGTRTFFPNTAEHANKLAHSAPPQVTRVAENHHGIQTSRSTSQAGRSVARENADHRDQGHTKLGAPVQWAATLWVIGFLCALAPTAAGLFSLWRLQRKSCVEASGRLLELLERLATHVGLRRRIRLLTTESRQMPMTWGFLRPRILLPKQALEWPEERRQFVLLHELAHVERWDAVTSLLTRVACALYWFNPLVWLAARQLRLEQEQACDDTVLSAGTPPADYAEELLRIAAARTVGSVEACGALAMARPSTLEERLLAILDGTRNRAALNRVAVGVIVLVTTLAVIPMSMLRAAQQPAANSPAGSPDIPAAPGIAATPALNDGLVAWWRADGDGKDSVGKHDGEFPFDIRYLPGASGQAFDFRRSYVIQELLQRVNISESPEFQLSETMTLEARIHPMRYGGIVLLRGDDRPGFDTWQLDLITPGKISFNFDSAENKSAEILAPIQLNQWQHVVATFDRGAMRLYINGVLAAAAQTTCVPIQSSTRGMILRSASETPAGSDTAFRSMD